MVFKIPDITYDWRALSIKQPAASLIVDGHKTVENRSVRQYKHDTLQGKWILIHASVSSVESKENIAEYIDIDAVYTHPMQLPRGKIIGLAHIKGVYTYENVPFQHDKRWAHSGDACIVFDIVIKLNTPVDAPGALSLWILKPAPKWTEPKRLTEKESHMTCSTLKSHRTLQKTNYYKKAVKKTNGTCKYHARYRSCRVYDHTIQI